MQYLFFSIGIPNLLFSSAKMKGLMFTLLLYIFLQTTYLPVSQCVARPTDGSLIKRTCKQTPFYDLCISSLQSDHRSTGTDIKGLAHTMFDVIKAKATIAQKHIHGLLQGRPKPDLHQSLSSCADKYKTVVNTDVPVALEALEKGNPKFAEQGANDAANEANTCETSFSGNSALTGMNEVVHDVAVVAAAIARTLL